MTVSYIASMIKPGALGAFQCTTVTRVQSTSGLACQVTVTGPRGPGTGDSKSWDMTDPEEMYEVFDREVNQLRADGWKIEYTREDGPGARSVREPAI